MTDHQHISVLGEGTFVSKLTTYKCECYAVPTFICINQTVLWNFLKTLVYELVGCCAGLLANSYQPLTLPEWLKLKYCLGQMVVE